MITLIQADARRIPLPDKSVHCVVTSPPYWGLRDYGVDGQIGLESSPDAFVASMRRVFGEVWRVLRDDGTCWLNLGDSYSAGKTGRADLGMPSESSTLGPNRSGLPGNTVIGNAKARLVPEGLKPKDLVGIPWRVAFALQADGWTLRSDIIWHKRTAMPESVTDRPTKSHEYLFLLAKQERYYYDLEAVKEPISAKTLTVSTTPRKATGTESTGEKLNLWMEENGGRYHPESRNLRTVWSLTADPFPGAHFATFPRKLVEPCIKAGTSEKGCCPHCGSPWMRITERTKLKRERPNDYVKRSGQDGTGNSCSNSVAGVAVSTKGWEPSCACADNDPIPCTVFDPFNGAGTTGVVATGLHRYYIGTDLNRDYLKMAKHRIERPHAAIARVSTNLDELPLFEMEAS